MGTLVKAKDKIQRQISSEAFRPKSPLRQPSIRTVQSQVELRETPTNLRPRRPKSQCRSRPESWNESEKDGLKIFKSTDDIFGSNVPPPIPKKDQTPITSPTHDSNEVFNFPVLPPKNPIIPEKAPKKDKPPPKPPLKPPLPS